MPTVHGCASGKTHANGWADGALPSVLARLELALADGMLTPNAHSTHSAISNPDKGQLKVAGGWMDAGRHLQRRCPRGCAFCSAKTGRIDTVSVNLQRCADRPNPHCVRAEFSAESVGDGAGLTEVRQGHRMAKPTESIHLDAMGLDE